jgi:isocitrate dehydrogenase kinase/phosphatase
MMVFGLSSYQTVFKVLKDKFPATKSVTHDDVKAAYKLVKTHDRVGRMADTQEFKYFQFLRSRFEDELVAELLKVAPASIEIHDDIITIKHLYTERMMTPLNIYVQWCSEFQLKQVLQDYGRAIKELAAANIFPGDMLLKNFGVTRHGRVVFYDYDEICYLTDVNFRKMPQRADEGMSAEPWFDVGEFDVFPEEFSTFLFPDDHMQSIFREFHADLFRPEGWIRIQEEVRANLMMDVFPYPDRMRLAD